MSEGKDPVPVGQEGEDSEDPRIGFLNRAVALQEREAELKAAQLEFDKQKDNNALEFGKESLAAQERDRKDSRQCGRDQKRDTYRLIFGLAVILTLLIGFALYRDKDAIAVEIVKALIFLVAGAAAGVGWERKTSAKKAPEDGTND